MLIAAGVLYILLAVVTLIVSVLMLLAGSIAGEGATVLGMIGLVDATICLAAGIGAAARSRFALKGGGIVVFGLLVCGVAVWRVVESDTGLNYLLALVALIAFILAAAGYQEWAREQKAGAPSGMRPCPHCAEKIQAAAKICRYCQRAVDGK